MTPAELQDALEPTRVQIQRLADVGERLLEILQTPEPEPPGCRHPESERLLLGQGPSWMCQVCQHQELIP